MADFVFDHITEEHYTAFGMIIRLASEIEGLMDEMMITIVGGKPTFLPILMFLTQKDKRDYIHAMIGVGNLPPYARDGLERLLDRANKVAGLRNQIAHSPWVPGRKVGTIKPATLSARKVLRVLGLAHNEKEWTAAQLRAEAVRIQGLGREIANFMIRYGLTSHIPVINIGKKSRSSVSDGG